MSINFVINSQLYKDSIIGAYTLFWDSIRPCLYTEQISIVASDLSDSSDLSDLSEKGTPAKTRHKRA